jgi:serine/threonine protein kinase
VNPSLPATEHNIKTLEDEVIPYFSNSQKRPTRDDGETITKQRIMYAGNKGIIVLEDLDPEKNTFHDLKSVSDNQIVDDGNNGHIERKEECKRQKEIKGLQAAYRNKKVLLKFGYTREELEFQTRICESYFFELKRPDNLAMPFIEIGNYNGTKVTLNEYKFKLEDVENKLIKPIKQEYSQGCSIGEHIRKIKENNPKSQPFSNEKTLIYLKQILNALSELQCHKIMHHRDLQLENILIDDINEKLTIIDLGEATTDVSKPIKEENRYRGRHDYDAIAQIVFAMLTGENLINQGMVAASKSKASDEYYSQFKLNFEYEDSALHLQMKAKIQKSDFKYREYGIHLERIIQKLLLSENHSKDARTMKEQLFKNITLDEKQEEPFGLI